MRLVEVILGVLIEEPMMLLPAMRIPLKKRGEYVKIYLHSCSNDGEAKGKSNTNVGPRVRIGAIPHIAPASILLGFTDPGTHFSE